MNNTALTGTLPALPLPTGANTSGASRAPVSPLTAPRELQRAETLTSPHHTHLTQAPSSCCHVCTGRPGGGACPPRAEQAEVAVVPQFLSLPQQPEPSGTQPSEAWRQPRPSTASPHGRMPMPSSSRAVWVPPSLPGTPSCEPSEPGAVLEQCCQRSDGGTRGAGAGCGQRSKEVLFSQACASRPLSLQGEWPGWGEPSRYKSSINENTLRL